MLENSNELFTEAAKSTLDKDYKSKGKKKLSSFKRIHITEEVINRYKKEYPSLKHVRCKDTKEYICDGYLWMNDNDLVATVGSCTYRDDKTKWVVSLEVMPKYRGYGLSEQVLEYAVKTMKCTYLSVNKKNEIAKKVYDKYGFKVYKESDTMYYMALNQNINERSSYCMERQNGKSIDTYVDKRLSIFEAFHEGSITEAERDDLLDALEVAYEYGGNRAMLDAMRATRKRMVACRERKEEITTKIKQLEGDLNAVDDDRKDEIKEQIAKLREEYDEVDKKHHQLADSVKFESAEKGWVKPSNEDWAHHMNDVITESFIGLAAGISGAIIVGKAIIKLAKKVEDKSTKKTEDDGSKTPVKIDTSSIDKGITELEKCHTIISNIEKKGGNPTNVIVDASLILDDIAKKQREIYDATEEGTPERDVAKELGKRIAATAAKLKICTSKGTTAEVKTEAVIVKTLKDSSGGIYKYVTDVKYKGVPVSVDTMSEKTLEQLEIDKKVLGSDTDERIKKEFELIVETLDPNDDTLLRPVSSYTDLKSMAKLERIEYSARNTDKMSGAFLFLFTDVYKESAYLAIAIVAKDGKYVDNFVTSESATYTELANAIDDMEDYITEYVDDLSEDELFKEATSSGKLIGSIAAGVGLITAGITIGKKVYDKYGAPTIENSLKKLEKILEKAKALREEASDYADSVNGKLTDHKPTEKEAEKVRDNIVRKQNKLKKEYVRLLADAQTTIISIKPTKIEADDVAGMKAARERIEEIVTELKELAK